MSPHATIVALLLVVATACASTQAGTRASPSIEASAGPVATADLSAPCTGCHPQESADWKNSLHRVAFTDADFQASFKDDPLAFCLDCHAPAAKSAQDAHGTSLGVGCPSCHTAAPGHPRGAAKTVGTTDCARCHEFNFPGREAMMQTTVTEHRASPLAAISCASCHARRAPDGHVDHRFAVTRESEFLRAALELTAERTAKGVEVRLATRNVGHAMPTGDLFRRMRVIVRATSADHASLGEEEVLLGRRFSRRAGVPYEREDSRIRGSRSIPLEGDWLTAASTIDIEVRYERVAQTMEVTDVRGNAQRRETIFDSVILAETSLGPAFAR